MRKLNEKIAFFYLVSLNTVFAESKKRYVNVDDAEKIEVIDLTQATTWRDLSEYYEAIEKRWKLCLNCGVPGLGTAMHMELPGGEASMHLSVIPPDYLVTRLSIIDVTGLSNTNPPLVLTLDVAQQWISMKHDPREPTLLLFKFGWSEEDTHKKVRSCICEIPGLSYELAEWIATNMSHVVGVGTDAPTLESEQTREFSSRTVANLLGRSGVYIVENVNLKTKLPEQSCMVTTMPLKLLNANYVPARVTAFCPTTHVGKHVALTLRGDVTHQTAPNRLFDVDLDEILNN
ncbi:uncharacterized protein LOC101735820 [Bombyx mori]|uniref:Uncharacterized protein n=1 Tax=Bombyx mori TaxID=7091 RepID=A0A8R2AG41_BOMMO|nr:uncharacterized protein LOC101735820 [Bombyx mori]